MKKIIAEKLLEIEQSENVRIIHAVESGSRAWGFASTDSDYDVRFIYVRKPEFYLKLEKTRDVIEWQLDEVLDINGWDLQKMLRLLYKSNSTVFEWNRSPIVYKTTQEWENIRSIIDCYFSQKNGIYHYLSTAKSNYREYLKCETVKFKKYFYVLRPILACRWILDRKTPPPMLFSELVEAELVMEMRPDVNRLLEIKMNASEAGTGSRLDGLNRYIERSFEEIENELNSLPDIGDRSWEQLNEIFLKIVFGQN